MNRHVFNRSGHNKGQILQSRTLLFHTTGPKEAVREWVISHLPVRPSQPKMGGGLVIEGVSGDTTRFSYGSSFGGELAAFDLDLEQHGQTTTGTVTLLRWQELDGVMSAAGQMEQFHQYICQAVTVADPQSTINAPLAGLH